MKRTLSLLLAILVVLGCCACTQTDSAPVASPTPAPTPVPTPTPTPEPPSEPGTVRVLSLPIVWTVLNRGDTVSIVRGQDEYYVVNYEGNKLYIEKRFVRLNVEETPEERTVYAASKAKIFKNAYLNGTELAELKMNDELTLLDELNGISLVEFEDIKGYISSDEISDTKYSSWGYYGGGGGGAGGGGGGGGGSDGGDIALGYVIRPKADRSLVMIDDTKLKGTVFSDDIELYVDFLSRGDTVKVTDEKEGYYSILYNGTILVVPSFAVRLDSEEKYEKWDGFAKSGAKLYSDTELDEETAEKLSMNTELTVLDEFDKFFLVQIKNETDDKDNLETEAEEVFGYVLIDDVSDTKISSYWGGWDGGGAGGGGGGGEWTAPVL